MANSYFEFKKFRINQDKSAFKVTTDSCILGAYVSDTNAESICDIGTGSGILALMLAQRFQDSRIDAVEIDELSAIQARDNIKASPWPDRIDVFNESIQEFSISKAKKYDLIVCNPPFYEDHLKSRNRQNNITRHNYMFSIKELAGSINTLLQDHGIFYTIMPPFSFNRLQEELDVYDIRLIDKLSIHSSIKKPLYRNIGGFSRKTDEIKTNTLVISDDQGEYSEDYRKLLKDYYLEF